MSTPLHSTLLSAVVATPVPDTPQIEAINIPRLFLLRRRCAPVHSGRLFLRARGCDPSQHRCLQDRQAGRQTELCMAECRLIEPALPTEDLFAALNQENPGVLHLLPAHRNTQSISGGSSPSTRFCSRLCSTKPGCGSSKAHLRSSLSLSLFSLSLSPSLPLIF